MIHAAQTIATTMNTTMNTTISSSMISDAMSDPPSSPESSGPFDDSDLLSSAVHDDVTAQLAASGPIGVAAAAAIATGKKRKRPHSFETNPSIRKRQQTRLLRKLKATIDEYTTRVGQQAVVLCCTPGKASQSIQSFKVFGSQPLENVVRNCRGVVMQDLEAALAQQAPPAQPDNPTLHELPPLVIDGIPTPVDKMTQAQLRAFIPEMLKYSTGRSKPGWGKHECRPVWWPSDLPWANVRSDVRSEEDKKKVSWTHALRTIVKNCYKHHGRDDLLPEFSDPPQVHAPGPNAHYAQQTMVQTINNPDGTVSIIQIDTGDGTNPQVVTLADGTQAQVVHTALEQDQGTNNYTIKYLQEDIGEVDAEKEEASEAVHTIAKSSHPQQLHVGVLQVGGPVTAQTTPVNVELNNEAAAQAVATLAEATINQDGQIILTGETGGLGAGDGSHSMVTIPVSMYQTVVTSIAQLNEAQQQQQQQQQQQNVQVAMAPNTEQQSGEVPDATHAVEVMTVEQT